MVLWLVVYPSFLLTKCLISCYGFYRKFRVSAEPLSPTWLPMTSTIEAVGLLHFSLRVIKGELYAQMYLGFQCLLLLFCHLYHFCYALDVAASRLVLAFYFVTFQ